MKGYPTWKYLVINLNPTEEDLPRVFFVDASCRSEAEYYIKKRLEEKYMIVDKYNEFVAKILDYPEIPHDKFQK